MHGGDVCEELCKHVTIKLHNNGACNENQHLKVTPTRA